MINFLSPTCEDFGISRESLQLWQSQFLAPSNKMITLPCGQVLILNNSPTFKNSTLSNAPHTTQFATFPPYLNGNDLTNVRRRNERERERVRCVNEGYAKLRRHLPPCDNDKRLSKVDTLNRAIQYIKHLTHLLDELNSVQKSS